MIAVIARSGHDQGLDLVAKAATQILRNDVQLVLAIEDEGDGEMVAAFEDVWDRWPDRFQVRTSVDDALVHRVLAATDLLLIPARRSPDAMRAKIAQRYGAVPIATCEGALSEALVDCDARLQTGNAILFDLSSSEELLGGVRRGVAAFAEEDFKGLQQRVMRIDASWDRSARLFERLYKPEEPESEGAASDTSEGA